MLYPGSDYVVIATGLFSIVLSVFVPSSETTGILLFECVLQIKNISHHCYMDLARIACSLWLSSMQALGVCPCLSACECLFLTRKTGKVKLITIDCGLSLLPLTVD